jgi:hypothetical protein
MTDAEPGTVSDAVSEAVPGAVSGAQWVQWWCTPWEDAHASWQHGFAEQAGLTLHASEHWARRCPDAFMAFAGVYPPQPPAPEPQALQWLALAPAQRELALALVTQICAGQPSGHADDSLAPAHVPWCRSLAKALRPGLWLGDDPAQAPALLGAWLGPHYWARLRLAWPMPSARLAMATLTSSPLALARLNTLWPAVLWRVAAN